MNTLFVYGTLMTGKVNYQRFLEGQEFLGSAILNGYALYNLGWYPGAIKSDNCEDKVKGEVFRIDDNALRQLDYLEDNGGLYIRKFEKVHLNDGLTLEAYVYEYQKAVREEDKVDYLNQPWG